MAPTTAGNTSIRPRSRRDRSDPEAEDSFSAARRSIGWAYGTIRLRSTTGATSHGKKMRDLRQGTAVRTQREPLQGAQQPALPAQSADGPGEDRRAHRARSRLHALPAHPRLGLT